MELAKKVMDIKGYPWFVNLMDILEEHLEVFFDRSHITTEGNQIIAVHIYEHIKDDIK